MSQTLTAPATQGMPPPSPPKSDPVASLFGDANRARQNVAADDATLGAMEDRARAPRLTPPPPQAAVTDPLQAFGQPAMWIAAIGSLMTRRPFVNAINSAGQVLKATHEQDQAAATNAYNTWKVESDNAIKLAKYEQDAYKAAIAKKGVDVREADASLRATISAFKNAPLLQVYQQEGFDGVTRYLKSHDASLTRVQEGALKIKGQVDDLTSRTAAFADWATQNPAAAQNAQYANAAKHTIKAGGDPDARGLPAPKDTKNPLSGLSPGAQYDAAVYYIKTKQLPGGFGGMADRDAIQNKAHDIMVASGINATDWPSIVASTKADTMSLGQLTKQTNAISAYEQGAAKELDYAVSLLPKTAEPMDSQLLTRWMRTGETQFGDVAVPKYMAALMSGLDEYAKVLSGSTGAAGSSDASRAQALSLIPAGATTEQVPGIVDTLKQGMKFKTSSYQEKVAEVSGKLGSLTGAAPSSSGGVQSAPSAQKGYRGETPPPRFPTAKKAPDGNWYVLKDGKYLMVPE